MTQWSVLVAGGWELAERPLWDGGRLVWVDVFGGRLWRREADGTTDSVELTTPTAFVALREGGGYVVGSDTQLVFLDHQFVVDAEPIDVALPVGVRFNDGACDPAGRLWFGGACTDGSRGRAPLYCFDPRTRDLRQMRDDVTESNGIGWSSDGRAMFYVDSGEPLIQAYDYDVATGVASNRRDIAHIDRGLPDGLAVDAEGTIWLALWERGAVRRYSPEGDLLAEIETPVSNPTCPALGGPDGRTLVVTTGWEGQSVEQRAAEPWSGHLLSTTVDAVGAASHRFAG